MDDRVDRRSPPIADVVVVIASAAADVVVVADDAITTAGGGAAGVKVAADDETDRVVIGIAQGKNVRFCLCGLRCVEQQLRSLINCCYDVSRVICTVHCSLLYLVLIPRTLNALYYSTSSS